MIRGEHPLKPVRERLRPQQQSSHRHGNSFAPIRRDGKMRVLYLITRAERGGAQIHVLALAHSMRAEFEVAVATGEHGFLTEACRERAIPVHVLRHLRRQVSPLADAWSFWEICQLIREVQPDLIHAHTSKAGFLGRLAGHILGVPSVHTVHALSGTAAVSGFWGVFGVRFERLAASWCERLIAVSDEGAQLVLRHRIGHPSKVVTIHNGIPDCSALATLIDRPPVITMVARFAPVKDHPTLLRAFANLHPGPCLRLVGDGPLRQDCERLAHELGIGDRVEFLGDRDDIPRLLASSDVFVLASKYEMLPLSVLEAMRAGLPVIASDVGGMRETIVHGETGLLVPCGSVAALAQALTQLVEKPEFRLRLGGAGRRRFEERFLYQRQEERTRSLYWDVLLESGRCASGSTRAA